MKINPKRNKNFKAHHYADGNSFTAFATNREKKNVKVYVAADESRIN